ncbi:23S rRNA (uracil(1939)-C(5))-methyltransferase RlmD [Fenollaria sporofastidiosus]|uniref:23S rRNA (uracil(1939)-C(5))-methyltransferase RlmD n=1 Tax=Fenollaria sporofastidiosus TaxID=2811778 RepID=UPI001BFFFF87|nr:23S rRNA (uracil(1939)-C(5))-methyltransferase RlmD [Fenollaria sporofastidiosus]
MRNKREELDLIIQEQEYPNLAFAFYEDKKYMVKNEIQGRKLRLRTKRKKNGAYLCDVLERLEASPLEKGAPCTAHEECGGCLYQTLKYEDETRIKKDMLAKLYREVYTGEVVFHPSLEVEGYRNKMEYTFSDCGDEERTLSLGLHKKKRFYEVAPTDDCNIVHDDFTKIRIATLDYFKSKGITYYHKKLHEGVLRHLVIRKAYFTKEILINLVTTSDYIAQDDFIKMLLELDIDGEIKSIYHTKNDSLSDVVQADELILVYGKEDIDEKLLGLKFKIGPFSFFQTNSRAAQRMYKRVQELLEKEDMDVLFDLYSGTGTIAQILAKKAKKVYSIEIVEEASEKARLTCKDNGIDNVEVINGDVLKVIDEVEERPDAIVIDPPREGVHPKALKKLIDYKAEKIIYVSCNPKTQVSDLKKFTEAGYKIKLVEIFDNFPKTSHVESVVLMSRVERK